jgi:actin-like ATPase involved in cell morphogenesis
LAIDFGTSYTVAAVRVGSRPPEVIDLAGASRLPSVILAENPSHIVVGEIADELSTTNPAAALRTPKDRLGDAAPVILAGHPYQAEILIAELLRSVYDMALRRQGSAPTEVRLTHPATWNRPRLNRLLEAAAKAGIPTPVLVAEPEAAAMSYASEVGVQAGAYVAVYDLGGGTFDSAVLTATGNGFDIVGRPGGDSSIGGELFDELLSNAIGERLDPAAWHSIQVADEPQWRQVASVLRKTARRAKETLSSHPYADLLVPLPTGMTQVRITREEFEEIVRPYIEETVSVLGRTLANAGVSPSQLEAVYLVGGASRSPIVEQLVEESLPGVTVSRRGDPKTATATGATLLAPRPPGAPHGFGVGSTEDEPARTDGAALLLAPPVAAAGVAAAVVAGAGAAHAVSGPPAPPGQPPLAPPAPPPPNAPPVPAAPPPGAPGAPAAPAPPSPPPAPPGGGLPPPGPSPLAETPSKKRRSPALVLGILGVLVALVIAGIIAFSGGGSEDASESDTTTRRTDSADESDGAGETTKPPRTTVAAATATTKAPSATGAPQTTVAAGAGSTEPSPPPSTVPGVPQPAVVDDLGITFGYRTFVVQLGKADYQPDAATVVIAAVIENKADGDRGTNALDYAIALVDGGNTYTGRVTDGAGLVPVGQKSNVRLEFNLVPPGDEQYAPFSFDTATVLVGNGDDNPATFPMSDPAVGIHHVPFTESLSVDPLRGAHSTITVHDVTVTWTTSGLSGVWARRGEAVLEITADAQAGGETIFPLRTMQLGLPDGTVTGAADSVPFDPILSPSGQTEATGLKFAFVVPEPAAGTYQLMFDGGTTSFDVAGDDNVQPLVPTPDLSCDRAVALGGQPADLTLRAARHTVHICETVVEAGRIRLSARATNAFYVGGFSLRLRVRIDGQDTDGAPVSFPQFVGRDTEAGNVVIDFRPSAPVESLDGALLIAGSDGDVPIEIPLTGSGEYFVPQTFDIGETLTADFGTVNVLNARVGTSTDTEITAAGGYVVELEIDVFNTTGNRLFVGRSSSLTLPDGTSVATGTSGSYDYDLQVEHGFQTRHRRFLYEALGTPGGNYVFTVTTDAGTFTLPFTLPEVSFTPS